FFRDQFGRRVRCLQVFAIRHFVRGAAGDRMRAPVGDAGRGGVDQPTDAVRAAGGNDVVGADHVGAVVAVMAAPRTGLGGVVEDCLAAARGGQYRLGVGQVAAQLARADGVQRRVTATIEAGHFVAALHQAAAQGLAEEAAAAGDEDFHLAGLGTRDSGLGRRLAAQTARRSRWILALWRMSTGSAGWNRKVSRLAVCAWATAISRSSWSS